MSQLQVIDFSDTIHYQHRSDLCLGIRALLLAASDKNIRVIDLSHNFLDVDGARAFASFLEENNTLQELRIVNCSLGQKSCELILKAIEKNKEICLQTIKLSGNDFGKDGMVLLGELLARMADTIEHLECRYLIDKEKGHNGLAGMLEGISHCHRLKTLDITENYYNKQMKAVAKLLKVVDRCEKLTQLRMSNLGFDKAACEFFVQSMKDLISRKWGLLNNLQLLEWEEVCFQKSSINEKYVIDNLCNIYNSELSFASPQMTPTPM